MSLKRSAKSQPRLEESVYTPVVFPGDSNVIFESSLPSTSSASPPPRSTTYLGELSRKHAAHAQIVREEPASPPRCQGEDSDDEAAFAAREERINTLRNRVQDALIKAERNPADGKWVFLAQLLRMGVTSGRGGRWFGVRTDLQPPESLEGAGLGWLNAKTEAEWKEWEKHYQEERRVKDKVERWKKKVQPPSKVSSMHRSLDVSADVDVSPVAAVTDVLPQNPTSDSTTATNPINGSDTAAKEKVTLKTAGSMSKPITNPLTTLHTDPLKDTAPFGFGVVKRLKTVPVGKPTAASGKPEAEKNGAHPDKAKEMSGPSKKVVDGVSNAKPTVIPASTRDTNIRHIADLSDLSFFPPSFPSSQMITSTPKAAAKPLSKTRNLESMPIIPAPPSSDISDPAAKASSAPDPSSSPRVTKTYGRHNQGLGSSPRQPLEISASLPAIPTPSTPTRNAHERNTKNVNQINDDDDNVKNTNNKRALPAPSTLNNANDDHERALKKARTMSTLNGLVATPSRNRAAPQQILTSFPRPRSPRTPKAARVDGGGSIGVAVPAPALPATSSPLTPLVSTPIRQEKKQAMPTLTELLASAKRDKGKGKKKAIGGAAAGPAKPGSKGKAPEGRPAPVTEEDHAENEAWINHEQPPPPADAPVYGYDTGTAFDIIHSEEVNQYLMDPYAIDPVQDPHSDHPGLDVDVSIDIDFSPTKSLSSLAGSDSEDEPDDMDGMGMGMGSDMDFSFRPLATSTQRAPFGAPDPSTLANANANHNSGSGYVRNESGASKDSWASIYASAGAGGGGSGGNGPLPPSSSHPYPSYNSQFGSEVARQVDKVDKLLEKELDYEGWLRDPSEEADGGGYGQNSLGHEVEESP
ncbi:hypothetical protein GALMADRAFT_240682 [Galerina marginata CBS 339.88]|uniref:Uncharacterized protein n=1 Tax=Galerina marginata (strain CBS 339.88) TaxID=685588 RepID=A0A067TQF2_GALM3|nr:hypothetical protein GALMADRAFT_240682 [Galerina marginata CBS 339.88]